VVEVAQLRQSSLVFGSCQIARNFSVAAALPSMCCKMDFILLFDPATYRILNAKHLQPAPVVLAGRQARRRHSDDLQQAQSACCVSIAEIP
jgi:hypothetical protein